MGDTLAPWVLVFNVHLMRGVATDKLQGQVIFLMVCRGGARALIQLATDEEDFAAWEGV